MEFNSSLKLIMILSDGINGHVNQSRGVAYWLSALSNAEVVEADVPSLDKISKLRARFMAKKVSKGSCKPQKFVKNFHNHHYKRVRHSQWKRRDTYSLCRKHCRSI